jgi:hypothetical protein
VTGASASGNFGFRLRTSGTDNSNANYQIQVLEGFAAGVTASRSTNQTSWPVFAITSNKNLFIIDLIAPKVADATFGLINSTFSPNSTTIGFENYSVGFNASTQFDSLTILSTGANISGNLTAYGYNA